MYIVYCIYFTKRLRQPHHLRDPRTDTALDSGQSQLIQVISY